MKAEIVIEEVQVNTNNLEEIRVPKIDSLGRSYATGKRKNSIARVWIKAGKGSIIVNGLDYKEYFKRSILQSLIINPLKATNTLNNIDVVSTVKGGGLSGQAGALRHGISKALDYYNPSNHFILKPLGCLTRDSRVVESKKYGRKKARKSFQFSKR